MSFSVFAAAEEFEYMSGIATLQANAVEKTELAGEYIDKRTGLMYWETLDVAIPGNGGLDIEVYRSFGKHNASYFTLMQNWELELPRVVVPANPFGGIRGDSGAGVCNDPMPADFRRQIWTSSRGRSGIGSPSEYYSKKFIYPPYYSGVVYLPLKGDPYHTGLKLIIPGQPIRYLVLKHSNASQFLATVKYVTADNWTAECVQTPNTGRYDGFLVTAPNGTRYRMDQIARTNGEHENFTQPGEVTLYASEVRDVRANTLSYAYEVLAYPLTQLGEYQKTPRALIPLSISASDGRVVSFYYNRGPLYKIYPADIVYSTQGIFEPPVVKIVAQGQEWNYIYNGATLSEVRGPEDWTWHYTYNGPQIGAYHANWWISDYFRSVYRQARNHLSQITLPTGATVAYTYEGKSGDFWGGPANPTSVYPLKTRTLAGAGMTAGQWTYLLSKDTATFLEIQGPTKVERFQHDANYNSVTYSRLLSRQIFSPGATDAANRTPLRTETYSWLDLGPIGVFPPGVTQLPVAMNQRVVLGTRTVDNSFSTIYSNHDAYGNPGRIDESGHAKRTTTLTYFNYPANWIIGRLEDETVGEWTVDRTFDASGLLTKIVKLGVTESYDYHPTGDLWKKRWTKNNVPLEIVYESYHRGRPSLERHPEGVVIEREINLSGTLAWEKNGRGHTTRFEYDGLNRMRTLQPPVNAPTTIAWPTPLRQVLTRGTYEQSISYDGLGRELLTQRTDRSATLKTLYQKMDYDAGGRIRFKSHPSASSSEAYGDHTTYDALDRPLTLTRTSASANEQDTTSYCYDAGCANPLLRYGTIVTDARGYQTQYHQRVYGEPRQRETVGIRRQEQSVRRDGVDKYINTSFQRNLVGDLLRVYQGGRNRSYTYFPGTRLPRTINNPETGLTTLGYDEIGNLTSRQVGASGVTTWVHDGRNRLKNIYYPKQTAPGAIFYYDKTDNLVLANTGPVRRGYAYDFNGNLILDHLSIDNKSFAARYAYNDLDQLSTLTYPSGRQVSYLPDALDRPGAALPYVNNVTYHPNGTPQTLRYANGQVSTFGLNGRLWINRVTTGNGATTLSDIAYTYDPLGNTTSIIDAGRPAQALRYDGLSRLIEAGDTRINYDAADNITRLMAGSVSSTYNYDLVQNRLTSITGNQNANFSYDVYGNVTGNGRHTFAYDDASNLRNVVSAATSAAYSYDGQNRRVRTQTNGKIVYHLYARDGRLLGEYNAQGIWNKEYAYLGPKLVAAMVNLPGPGATPVSERVHYYHTDVLGSPVLATDALGNALWRQAYRPYGARIDNSPAAQTNTRGYTGHPQDDTGLIYAGARYYDPSIGRFLAVDSVGYSEQNLYSFNRYAYGNNNPYRYVDPDGRSPFDAGFFFYDVGGLAVSLYTGVGIGSAFIDLGISTVGLLSPVPGTGLGIKAGRAVDRVADGARSVGQIGREGEVAVRAAHDIGDKVRIEINPGQFRIPDGINTDLKVLSEVKNVKNLSFTKQLRDYSSFAQQNGLGFDLYVRPSTTLSGPLSNAIDSGLINQIFIP